MKLYYKNGKNSSLNYNENMILKNCIGMMSHIYRISKEECLKLFIYPTMVDEYNNLEKINEMKLKNFYEIISFLYNKKGTLFKGYTMKYYKKDDIDFLTMPTEYILENLYALYESLMKLAKEKILVDDLHSDNIILQKDRIIVIDADNYAKSNIFQVSAIEIKNSKKLAYLFNRLFIDSLEEYHQDEPRLETFESIQKLTSIGNTEGIEPICKKLIKYKYPIDYIRKNIR